MSNKIISQRQLPDLGVEGFYIHWRFLRMIAALKHIRRVLLQLGLPLGDLIVGIIIPVSGSQST